MRAPDDKIYFIDFQDINVPDSGRWRLVKRWIQSPTAAAAYGFDITYERVPNYNEQIMNAIDDWPPLPLS
jgi:hypothetical protein